MAGPVMVHPLLALRLGTQAEVQDFALPSTNTFSIRHTGFSIAEPPGMSKKNFLIFQIPHGSCS